MTTETDYDVGDVAILSAEFKNSEDQLIDPTAVTVRVLKPDGTLVSPAPTAVRDSQGLYHAEVHLDLAGRWRYRVEGSGEAESAEESHFDVRRMRVPSAVT